MKEPKPYKIYLGSRYSRLAELCGYRSEIHASGKGIVTSRWLDQPDKPFDTMTATERQICGNQDIADLSDAEAAIFFTQEANEQRGRHGARHVEFGIALSTRKTVIVVGPRENVFYYTPYVDVLQEWDWQTVLLILETECLRRRVTS